MMRTRTIHLDKTDSTNNYLKSCDATEDAVIVWTDFQTAGRGQRGNSWESEAGSNLLFSILIHPTHIKPSEQFCLSEAIALSIQSVLGRYADGVKIKWPNDIYVGDRKICGVLVENSILGSVIEDSIIGCGVNLNQTVFRSDAPNPVSLSQVTGREYSVERILKEISAEFLHFVALTESEAGRAQLHSLYLSQLYRKGQTFRYRDAAGEFAATIVNVRPTGMLVVCDEAGREREYAFKEISYII